MTTVFCSYFTPGYAAEAAGLVASLERFNLPHDVRPMPSRGEWTRNCAAKPAFLLAMREAYVDAAIVWLDADSRVVRELPPFADCDFAGHWFRDVELISACLYFAPTIPAGVLLRSWRSACAERPDVWDQKSLQRIVERERPPGLRMECLSPEWNWIQAVDGVPDLSEQAYGKREPFIVQRQASRRLKGSA